MALIASLPPFAGSAGRVLVELGRALEAVHAAPSELVQRQHEPSGWWTIVAEGSALATVDGIPLSMLRPGDAFGSTDAISLGAPCSATIMALTPMVLFTLDPRRFPALAERFPSLAGASAPFVAPADQVGGGAPRKKVANSPSTPAPCRVMPPSTTMV